VVVENKSYSLSFHYRTTNQRDAARALISRIVAELSPPPRIVLGKSVVNVMPPTASHKGTALLEYMRRLDCNAALYVGDDVTDEDVFALRDARILTVRIGRKNVPRLGIFYKDRQKSPRCFGCSSRSPTRAFTRGAAARNRESLSLRSIPTNSLSSILELASFSMR
jgi:trehalose-phosphatase